MQLTRKFGGVGLDPPLFIHRHRAPFEHVHRASQGSGLVSRFRERDLFGIVTLRDGFDGALECADGPDDSAKRQPPKQGGEDQGHADSKQHLAPRGFDGLDGLLAGTGRQLVIMVNPLVRDFAEAVAQFRLRPQQQGQGLVAASGVNQRHDPLGAGSPLPAQVPILVQQPPVLVVGDQAVRVGAKLLGEVSLVCLKGRPDLVSPRLVTAEKKASNANLQFPKGAGDMVQCYETADLRLRHEPAVRLNLRQLDPGKDPKPDQRQDRNGHQDDQTSCNRHNLALSNRQNIGPQGALIGQTESTK